MTVVIALMGHSSVQWQINEHLFSLIILKKPVFLLYYFSVFTQIQRHSWLEHQGVKGNNSLQKSMITDTRIKIQTNCSVWSKMGTFQMSFLLCKSTATLLSTWYVLAINKTFQMRYCMKLYLKGHQKYKQWNFWLSKFT